MRSPPILWDIELDPHLVGAKMIAEAWDAGGLYQVGTFVGYRWAEWNGRYRDDVRRFLRGDDHTVVDFAARVAGSRDIYSSPYHAPYRSVNFVTCHDGFTLNDLVSYRRKHNEANGESNRDGRDDNYSENYGVEGPTERPAIEAVRLRQIKNALAVLLTSQGTPMLLYGDEVRRTQGGNNNAYCQDNETSWFNWEDVSAHRELLRFTQLMIRFHRDWDALNLRTLPNGHGENGWSELDKGELTFHGVRIGEPDWSHISHSVALSLSDGETDAMVHILFNAYWDDLAFELPPHPADGPWYRFVDTALPSPADIADPGQETPIDAATYTARARSVVILVSQRRSSPAPV
jgi:glycogen operon protein